MMSSYSGQRFLESQLASQSNRYTPIGESLSTVNRMHQMEDLVDDSDEDESIRKVAIETMKYNTASTQAIANNPGLAGKYGGDVKGVETLEMQLKQYQAERVYNAVLNNALKIANDDPKEIQTYEKFDVDAQMLNLGYLSVSEI
jgi:hypothetical protein